MQNQIVCQRVLVNIFELYRHNYSFGICITRFILFDDRELL